MRRPLAQRLGDPMSRRPERATVRARGLGKTVSIIAGLGGLLLTFLGLLFSNLYGRAVDCGVDRSACQTQVALQSILIRTPSPAVALLRETAEVTIVHTLIATRIVCESALCPTPTAPSPYHPTGPCDPAFSNAPCTYVLQEGDRWEQLAQDSPYGDNCRYPEILDVNRREDGTYPRLSGYDQDVGRPITILPAAPRGTYRPRYRNPMGEFVFVPPCEQGGLPCLFTVTERLPIFTYAQISQEIYRVNTLGENIAQANLASDCSRKPITLELGSQVVIPKRSLPTPE